MAIERTTYIHVHGEDAQYPGYEETRKRSPMPPCDVTQEKLTADQRPQMGEWRTIYGKGRKHRRTDDKMREHVWWMIDEIEPIKAMYIGYRTVQEGHIYSDWDSRVFSRKRGLEAWMFVTNDRTNPIYVFPEDAEDIDDAN